MSIVHTEQLEGKEILVAGNVSYEECIVLFETENFTKIKKFENKPILRTGSICEVDEDTIAIEASFLNIITGELNSFTKFYGACYDEYRKTHRQHHCRGKN